MNDLQALVSLNIIPQIGSVRLEALLKSFQSPQNIFQASFDDLAQVVGQKIAQNIISFDPRLTENDLVLAGRAGAKVVTLFDPEYPQALKEIPGRPIVLYILGQILAQDNLALGIVGSRRASLYGLNSARIFAQELASCGVTIVSGLARGVDTYAHRGALKVKGRTIAVMGSGFSHIYPQENLELAKEIASSGAVISEFSMEAAPLACNFPRRNRLISGLSRGVLVTEAARNSGALITADFALEQGREVFALPGRIDSEGSTGTNYLLKQGAKLVTCCADIFEELDLVPAGRKEENISTAGQKTECSVDVGLLYDYIGREPVAIDELIERSALSTQQVLSAVLQLQFKKLIRELPGKQFMRN